jgi:hypothetical protein
MTSPLNNKIIHTCLLAFVFAFPVLFISFIILRYDLKMVDDGYYYLQIAWNGAHGRGLTFDGIHLTNGFQPLWQFVLIPLFWIFKSKAVVPYVVVYIQSILFTFSGVFLYRLIQSAGGNKSLAWTGAFIWLCNPWILFKGAGTGMETGLFMFLWALVSFYIFGLSVRLFSNDSKTHPSITIAEKKTSWLFAGLLLALTVASRLDAVFLAVSAGIVLAYYKKFRQALFLCCPTLLFLLAYFAVNQIYFGHISPISGSIKSEYGKKLLLQFLDGQNVLFISHLAKNMILYLTGGKIPLVLSASGLSIVIFLILRLLHQQTKGFRLVLPAFVLYSLLLITFYAALYENVMGTYKYYWLPVIWCGLFLILSASRTVLNRFFLGGMMGMFICGTLVFSFFYLRDTLKTVDFNFKPKETPVWQTIDYMNHSVPDDALFGSWDAGMIGYYCNKPVINLDGLVNDYDFLQYVQQDRLDEYIKREGITHLVNCDYYRHHRRWIEGKLKWKLIFNAALPIGREGLGTRFTVQPGFSRWADYQKIEYFIYEKPPESLHVSEPVPVAWSGSGFLFAHPFHNLLVGK